MAEALRFGEVVEAAAQLSEDEQEELVEIVHRRLAERRRDEIAAEVSSARKEHEHGEARIATPDELMDEILR